MNFTQQNVSKKSVFIVIFGGLLCLLIFSVGIYNSFAEKTIIYNKAENTEANNLCFAIDSQEYDKGTNILSIKGWAVLKGESIKSYKCNVILKDKETGSLLRLPTKLVIRKDVTEALKSSDSNFNYDKSGFIARVRLDKIEKSLQNYEIYLDYKNNDANLFVKTGVFLAEKGE